MSIEGIERSFISRVPPGGADGRPHDLVVAFHGRTNPANQVQDYFDLDEALPDAIIVYPNALPAAGGFAWANPGDPVAELRDFALFDALIIAFGDAYCVDLDRVFVVGHSLGASFANSLACSRGAAIRAVASVAGGITGEPCSGGAAAMVLHHPDDRLVPISEGERVREAFREANDLPRESVPASEPELVALGCVRYGRDSPYPVVWCVHGDALSHGGRYYPHGWPDGTAAAIARFFGDLPGDLP